MRALNRIVSHAFIESFQAVRQDGGSLSESHTEPPKKMKHALLRAATMVTDNSAIHVTGAITNIVTVLRYAASARSPRTLDHLMKMWWWAYDNLPSTTWKAKCPIFKAIVAGFRGKVALKNRTLGVPGIHVSKRQEPHLGQHHGSFAPQKIRCGGN